MTNLKTLGVAVALTPLTPSTLVTAFRATCGIQRLVVNGEGLMGLTDLGGSRTAPPIVVLFPALKVLQLVGSVKTSAVGPLVRALSLRKDAGHAPPRLKLSRTVNLGGGDYVYLWESGVFEQVTGWWNGARVVPPSTLY